MIGEKLRKLDHFSTFLYDGQKGVSENCPNSAALAISFKPFIFEESFTPLFPLYFISIKINGDETAEL